MFIIDGTNVQFSNPNGPTKWYDLSNKTELLFFTQDIENVIPDEDAVIDEAVRQGGYDDGYSNGYDEGYTDGENTRNMSDADIIQELETKISDLESQIDRLKNDNINY